VHPNDNQLSPLLPSLLRTISHLEYLRITSAIDNFEKFDWTDIDPMLQSALLHLMHLPTLTHFVVIRARNIPISALAPCINLEQLDIRYITVAPLDPSSSLQTSRPETPRILHFRIDSSQTAVGRLLRARWKDGHPVLDFTHIKSLVLDFDIFQDVQLTQELFENIKNLEELKINAQNHTESLAGLSEMISVNARNLRTLQLMTLLTGSQSPTPMIGLCEELEALARNNVFQILKFTFSMDGCESKAVIKSAFGRLEDVLMDQGWSSLMRVSIEIRVRCCHWVAGKLGLESIPEMYLGRLLSRKILDYKCPDFDSIVTIE
jgi:hypothetical protein